MKEALFYEKLEGEKVRCNLCPRHCILSDGQKGFCGVRRNEKGKLYSLVYGRLCSMNIDPIEKKPLFHFAPGSRSLSIATVGCNLKCKFCQNWEISMSKEIFGENVEPEEVVEAAKNYNAEGIAYTYVEPTIFYEFALDTMKLAKKAGLYNIWVSNGYTEIEPIRKMAKYLDAINVDLKGDKKFYNTLCYVADETPIKKALLEYKKHGIWIEVTTLLIPGYNDKKEQIEQIVNWVKENLGDSTPLHFSRFFPHYKLMDVPSTPLETLEKAFEIAKNKGMKYVYVGNVLGHDRESTFCPKCGSLVIKRVGFEIVSFNKKCPKCDETIPIKGEKWVRKF